MRGGVTIAIFLWAATAHAAHLWDHNGSTVSLRISDGSVKFYYELPAAGLPVAKGTLLFEGTRHGRDYSGKAFVFSRACGAFSYQVSGSIAEDGRTITLSGQAPQLGANCNIIGNEDDRLLFTELSLAEKIFRDPYGEARILASLGDKESMFSDGGEQGVSYTLDTCKYPSYEDDLCRRSADGLCRLTLDDQFIGEFSLIVDRRRTFVSAISKAGYPDRVWQPPVDKWFKARIDEISRRRTQKIQFNPAASRVATLHLERRIVQILNDYRRINDPRLPEVDNREICGGDWIGYVALKTDPTGGAIRLIGEYYFKYCRATDIPTFSSSCTRWTAIALNQHVPQGSYHYMASWPDGVTECDRVTLLRTGNDPDAVETLTIKRSGRGCK
jgi:hypothetical protein